MGLEVRLKPALILKVLSPSRDKSFSQVIKMCLKNTFTPALIPVSCLFFVYSLGVY